ncbi:aquaporin-like protein [Naematelia encephala]|uniref:Aquaporin-like protein n=1 Tax=Naematelia encephala TaxID=71784 RepID=A0A1Y2BJ52_9TREE|nr:aquaporin-like protein [Naematelia encephala]
MPKRSAASGLFADIKNDMVAMAGEFVGTVLFLMFALGAVQLTAAAQPAAGAGTQAAGDASGKIIAAFYVSAAFGISLFAFASVFFRATGSIFNPSVSLALVLTGVIKPLRFVLVSLAQMVGGIVAAAIVDGLTPGKLQAGVALSNGTSRTQGVFIEMFTTAGLVIAVLMLAAEKSNMTPLAPISLGFTLFAVMMFSVQFTGGAVNTARAFGPACIAGFDDYHWIYWVGPTLGALLATAFYVFLKYVHYWRVNPGADSTEEEGSPMQEV